MKQIFSFFVVLFLCFGLSGCGGGVTGDPETDADQMSKDLLSAAQANDVDKAISIMEEYYDYYSFAELEDRAVFLYKVNNSPVLLESEEWDSFVDDERFAKSDVRKKFDRLYEKTEYEQDVEAQAITNEMLDQLWDI